MTPTILHEDESIQVGLLKEFYRLPYVLTMMKLGIFEDKTHVIKAMASLHQLQDNLYGYISPKDSKVKCYIYGEPKPGLAYILAKETGWQVISVNPKYPISNNYQERLKLDNLKIYTFGLGSIERDGITYNPVLNSKVFEIVNINMNGLMSDTQTMAKRFISESKGTHLMEIGPTALPALNTDQYDSVRLIEDLHEYEGTEFYIKTYTYIGN